MKKPIQRIAALTLSAALALGCCGGALAADGDTSDIFAPSVNDSGSTNVIIRESYLDADTSNISPYMKGATADELRALLPATLCVTQTTTSSSSSNFEMVPISWKQVFDSNLGKPGYPDYRLQMELPEGYEFEDPTAAQKYVFDFYDCDADHAVTSLTPATTSVKTDMTSVDGIINTARTSSYATAQLANGRQIVIHPITWTADTDDLEAYKNGTTSNIRFYMNMELEDGYRIVKSFQTPVLTVHANNPYNASSKLIMDFEESSYEFTAENPTEETAKALLPSTINVKLSDSEDYVAIPVQWESLGYNDDEGEEYGAYEFKCILPNGYETRWGYTPYASVYTRAADKTITAISGHPHFSAKSDLNTIEAITAQLNAAYPTWEVTLYNGETVTLPITWEVSEYDREQYLAGNSNELDFYGAFPDEYLLLVNNNLEINLTVSHNYDPSINDAPAENPATPGTGTGSTGSTTGTGTGSTGDAAVSNPTPVTATSTAASDSKSADSAKTSDSKASKSPKTDDTSNAMLAASAFALSAAALTGTIVYRKKRENA